MGFIAAMVLAHGGGGAEVLTEQLPQGGHQLGRETCFTGHGAHSLSHPSHTLVDSEVMSAMNIWPGAWVMARSGRALAMASWGVTPQAQNTGT